MAAPAPELLSYPIGRWKRPEGPATEGRRREWIDQIAEAPAELRAAVDGLDNEQLNTPYREGGWTVRQLVHHVADSHLNAYARTRIALTEDEPTIKPYDQDAWAELPDARTHPVEASLRLLEALHERWTALLRGIPPDQMVRRFHHPQVGVLTVEETLSIYAWHGLHHVAHIRALRSRRGWLDPS